MRRWSLAIAAAVGLLAVVLARAAETPLFLTPTSLSVGPGLPTAILTPDLNGDGRRDVVITHYETYRLTPLLNNGDGSLTALAPADTAGKPLGALAARFDGDQHPDVIVVELESDNAWFLRGRGDGTFDDARGPIFVDHDPLVLAAGDFDEDRHLDLALARSPEGSGWLTVVLGNGDGSFGAPVLNARLNDFGVAIAVADLNEDGHADLIGSYSQTSIAMFPGNGDGTFGELQEIATGTRTPIIRPIDLDGDNHLDLFLVQTSSDRVAVMRGRGDGTFEAAVTYASGDSPAYLALDDINQDGETDAILESIISFDVRIMLGTGNGAFGPPRSFASIGMAQLVTSLDLNDDSRPEVIAATAPQGVASLSLFPVFADGSLAAAENLIGDSASGGVVADTNGDAVADLVVAMPAALRVGSFLHLDQRYGPAVLSPPLPFPVGRLAAGDFDGDGVVDLLAAAATIRAAAWLRGNGDGTFALATSLPLTSGGGIAGVIATDFDGDGRLDAILAHADGKIVAFRGRGDGGFDEPSVTLNVASAIAPAHGDFNSDGFQDLVTANTRQSAITVLLGDGRGAFTPGPSIPAASQLVSLLAADFDLDGNDDVAFADSTNSRVGIALNDGSGQFLDPLLMSSGERQMSLAARDVSADSRPDLLVALQEAAVVKAFINDGSFAAGAQAGVGQNPIATFSADFDGDGRYDVGTINDTTGTIATVVRNIGGTQIARADGNGDGRVGAADLVAIVHELGEGEAKRVDTSGRGFPATAGADADGDGLISKQDARSTVQRVFR